MQESMKTPFFSRSGFIRAFPCAVLLLAVASTAVAQTNDDENFSLSLGVFLTDRDSDTRIDGSSGNAGTNVDLEGDLGLDSSDSVFRVDGYYKFNDRHRIDFSWFDLSRSSSTQIDRDIEWNDTLYPLNTTLNSTFDLNIYKVAYTWSFLRRERNFLGLTAGLYIADFANELDAPMLGSRETASATAPLPVIGLRGMYYFSDKWSFRASGELFAFEYEDWDGQLVDLYVGIDYQWTDRFAVGAGFNSVTFDLGVAKSNFTGDVDWGYSGGLVFVRVAF